MDRAAELQMIARLGSLLAGGTTDHAETVRDQPADAYVDARRAEQERTSLFRNLPLVVEVSAALPNPGDFRTADVAGLPVLVVRGKDGVARCLVNVCRHRGNKVCLQEGGSARRFACQYHAWTYGLEGELLSVIDREGFREVAPAGYGLTPLPTEERHGLIFCVPTPGAPIDVAAFLGADMDRELADLSLHKMAVFADQTSATPFNWKLGVDTFLEVFHLAYLHKDTVAKYFIGNTGVHDDFGRHHRYVAARKTFPDMLASDEQTIYPHSSIVHFFFPNTFITWQMDHIEMWHFYPGDDVASSITRGRMLIDTPPRTPSAKRHWEKNWRVLLDTIWAEDFRTMQVIQRNLSAGSLPSVTFGRNEISLQRFHEKVERELAATAPGTTTDRPSEPVR